MCAFFCSEIVWIVDLLMSLSGLCPLWSSHFGASASIHRQRQKSDSSSNNSSLLMSGLPVLPLFPSACSPCLWTRRNFSVSMENVRLPGPVEIEHRGSSFYFCQSAARGRIGQRGNRGRRGKSRDPRGSEGPALLYKFICRRDHLQLVRLWPDSVNVLALLKSPGALSLIHTLKRSVMEGGGLRRRDVWSYIWPTWAVFI